MFDRTHTRERREMRASLHARADDRQLLRIFTRK